MSVLGIARNVANKALRPLGLEIVRTGVSVLSNSGRRAGFGSTTILGSFPPKDASSLIGPPETYFIHEGYRARSAPNYFDDFADLEGSADCQLEVYQFAKEICDRDQLRTICDVGCGSAVKLMQYFSGLATIGIDLPQTCDRLRTKWPARLWLDSFERLPPWPVDLLIASDVIEHLVEPNVLIHYITQVKPRWVIISTPDRDLIRVGTYNGPPQNPAHVREWNFFEFRAYINEFLEVDQHFVSCAAQFTQCVLCHLR